MKYLLIFPLLLSFYSYAVTDEECRARPAFDGAMSGVYREGDSRYVLFESCRYQMSGISVGTGDENAWYGHWTPVSSDTVSGNSEGGGGLTDADNKGSTGGHSGVGVVGKKVDLPDELSQLPLPDNVVISDAVGSQFSLYAQPQSTMTSGYLLGNSADAVAVSSILDVIKHDYNQPDIWFERTDSFGHTVKIKSNEYKPTSYTVQTKDTYPDSPNLINYHYTITTHTVRYDTSNVCLDDAVTFQTVCDADRAVKIEDSYQESGSRSVMVYANAHYGDGAYNGSSSGTGSVSNGTHNASSGGTGPVSNGSHHGSSGGTGPTGHSATGKGAGDFDYTQMAKANQEALTEEVNLSAIQGEMTADLDSTTQDIQDAFSSFSDSIGGLMGNGSAVTGDFAGSVSEMQKIGEGDKSPLLDSFLNGGFFPALPAAQPCKPFIFGSGEVYQFTIDCKYLEMFKSVFAFILYFWTFVTAYDTFAGILRKGKGA
ncbi:hypothetical protein LGZ99_20660 [Photorhabdus temperata]|uniref:Attachment protein G3P N-terminal domain-containing protein n=1 Tax=Photorhabdus cinerea TaxID=471575 RepID=A0A7X5QBD1_9GAMM|nr:MULTISPECIES: hypothetical protein [Photorhabdus]MCT8349541.1 hypothetical protein [Photorhabdus temperata]NHB91230.1 hypothetical protein [Photorhabdus cinerea]